MTPPDPTPDAEDYRRADLLIEGAGDVFAAPELRHLFAGGIAVARAGGDVKDYLRRQLNTDRLCDGLHAHYTGERGANVWTVYDGPGHGLMAPGLFTGEHAACADYMARGQR